MAMKTELITITPKMAEEFLAKNMKRNRPVMKSTVNAYARTMKAGGWNTTHQGIAFNDKGELIDGQHRLHAIIAANVPITMNVTYDVHQIPGEAFTIDMGRKRTYGNIAVMSGMGDDPVYKYMGSYVSAYIRWKMPGGRKADPAEIMAYIGRHYDDVKALFYCINPTSHGSGHGQGNRIPALVGAAMLSAIFRGEDNDALYRFSQVYRLNEMDGCQNYNPKYALNLRDWVRDHKYSAEIYQRCECSIWCFCHNRATMHLRDNCYPFMGAMDA